MSQLHNKVKKKKLGKKKIVLMLDLKDPFTISYVAIY